MKDGEGESYVSVRERRLKEGERVGFGVASMCRISVGVKKKFHEKCSTKWS